MAPTIAANTIARDSILSAQRPKSLARSSRNRGAAVLGRGDDVPEAHHARDRLPDVSVFHGKDPGRRPFQVRALGAAGEGEGGPVDPGEGIIRGRRDGHELWG